MYLAILYLTCGYTEVWSPYTLNIAAPFRNGFYGGFQKPLLGCTSYYRKLKKLLTELFSQPLYFDTRPEKVANRYMNHTFISNVSPLNHKIYNILQTIQHKNL